MIAKELLKPGTKIRIKGSVMDMTDHLNGHVVTVITADDEYAKDSVYVDTYDGPYYVWVHNIIEILED